MGRYSPDWSSSRRRSRLGPRLRSNSAAEWVKRLPRRARPAYPSVAEPAARHSANDVQFAHGEFNLLQPQPMHVYADAQQMAKFFDL